MIRIIIVSHKRANNVMTKKVFPNAEICIPQSQEEEYRKFNPEMKLLVHPDEVVGLSPKRQWILDNTEEAFQVDDDIMYVSRVYQPRGEVKFLSPNQVEGLVYDTYENAKEAGAYLFGFNSCANPMSYNGNRPIAFNKYITGGAFGIIKGSKLYFPDIPYFVGEDYWISLINAYFHRFSYIDDRFAFGFSKTERGKGGVADYRTEEKRKETYIFLKKSFGDVISLKKPNKIKKFLNKWEKTMTIPY